jgi:hypothetical protein
MGKILIRNVRNADGVHVNLLTRHQMEQQIERALKDVGFYCVGHYAR